MKKKRASLTKKAKKALRLAAFLAATAPVPLWAQSALENPGPDSYKSGIGLVSGWKCAMAGAITAGFDNNPLRIPVAYGTPRGDTQGVCGDSNNGFGLLWNFNLLGPGPHTVVMYDNGVEFARSSFTVTTHGVEFLRDAEGEVTIENFPEPGARVHLIWDEGSQGWDMDRYEPPTDSEDLLFEGVTAQGTTCNMSINPGGNCHARFNMNAERTSLVRSPRVEDVLTRPICPDGAAYFFLAACGSSIIGNFACGVGETVTNGHWEGHPRFTNGAYADIVADCDNGTCSGTYSTSGRPSPGAPLCETGVLTWTASLDEASAGVVVENPPVVEQLQDHLKAFKLEMTEDGFGHLTIPTHPE